MPEHGDSFLLRWSRRKRAARQDPSALAPDEPRPSDDRSGAEAGDQDTIAATSADTTASAGHGRDVPDQLDVAIPEDLAGVDIESLSYESDFSRFMQNDVPEALKKRALRQLWRSDPILANVDGLNDYDEDFTDAALAVKVLETIHKVGRGYLDDDEEDGAPEAPETIETADTADVAADEADVDAGGTEVPEASDAATSDDAPAPDDESGPAEKNTRPA